MLLDIKPEVVFIFSLIAVFSNTATLWADRLNFTPRASVSEEYTTNVFLDPENEEDDFITIISAGFTVQLLGNRRELEVSYDPAYAFYEEFDENNGWRYLATLSGWTSLTNHTRLEVRDEFFQTEDPLTREEIELVRGPDPILPEDTTVRNRGEKYYRNAASAIIIYDFGPMNSTGVGFNYYLRRDNDPGATDSNTYNPFTNITYWFSALNGLESRVGYTRGEFDDTDGDDESDFDDWTGTARLIHRFSELTNGFVEYLHTYRNFDGDNDNNYQVYEPTVGAIYEVPENISFSSRVGYFYQNVDGGNNGDGFVADGRLSKTWRNGSLNLIGSTGYTRADFGAENLGFTKFYLIRSDATYSFTERISIDIFIDYIHNKYTETDDNREDDVYRVGTEFSFQILSWMSLRLGYFYNEVNSTDSVNNYQEHRGLVSLSVSPATPFRY